MLYLEYIIKYNLSSLAPKDDRTNRPFSSDTAVLQSTRKLAVI